MIIKNNVIEIHNYPGRIIPKEKEQIYDNENNILRDLYLSLSTPYKYYWSILWNKNGKYTKLPFKIYEGDDYSYFHLACLDIYNFKENTTIHGGISSILSINSGTLTRKINKHTTFEEKSLNFINNDTFEAYQISTKNLIQDYITIRLLNNSRKLHDFKNKPFSNSLSDASELVNMHNNKCEKENNIKDLQKKLKDLQKKLKHFPKKYKLGFIKTYYVGMRYGPSWLDYFAQATYKEMKEMLSFEGSRHLYDCEQFKEQLFNHINIFNPKIDKTYLIKFKKDKLLEEKKKIVKNITYL